jgi:hypothetical protein
MWDLGLAIWGLGFGIWDLRVGIRDVGFIDGQFSANDWLQAGLPRGLVEARRTVDAVGIEEGERGVAERGSALDERLG